MRFFELKGRKVRLGIIRGYLCAQARSAGRLGHAVPLYPVPLGATIEECVAQLQAFQGKDIHFVGTFFGRQAEYSFLEGDQFDFFSVLAEIA